MSEINPADIMAAHQGVHRCAGGVLVEAIGDEGDCEAYRLAEALRDAQAKLATAYEEGYAAGYGDGGTDYGNPAAGELAWDRHDNPYRAALAGEGAAEVTLHADRVLPPDLARALVDLAQVTVNSVQPSYAVFVCAQGIIGCRATGEHQQHDLAERPFIRAQDGSGDAQAVTFGDGAADRPCTSSTCPDHAGRWMHEGAAEPVAVVHRFIAADPPTEAPWTAGEGAVEAGDLDRARRVAMHGPWRKDWDRYEDGCRADAPDHGDGA